VFSSGRTATVAEGGLTWRSLLTRALSLTLGAGGAGLESAPTGTVTTPFVVPVASAGLTYGVPRLSFTLDTSYAPQADALSGLIFQRAGVSLSSEYHPRSDLTARAAATGSFSVGDSANAGDRSVLGEVSLAYHDQGLEVSAGLRGRRRVPGQLHRIPTRHGGARVRGVQPQERGEALMQKLLLLSTVISLIALPVIASKDPNPKRALKKAILWLVAYNFFYLFAVRVIYPRLG